MDFKFIIFLCIFVIYAKCNNETVHSSDANNNNNQTNTTTVKLKPVCDLCNCKDGMINCTNRNLTDDLKDHEWPKETLKTVDFANNHLIHLKQFSYSPINSLILRRNQITKIDERAFKELINLTELDLSYNSLTSEILKPNVFESKFVPEANAPLEKLQILDLSYNALDSLDQFLFQHISGLRVLRLRGNHLTKWDLTKGAINSLLELQELDLSDCNLKTLPDHMFHQVGKTLLTLDLNHNQFDKIPSALQDIEVLHTFIINDNPIVNISDENKFPRMSKLKVLSISNMPKLEEIGGKTLSGLQAIEQLHIKNNPKLNKIHNDAFVSSTKAEQKTWPPLKILNLSDNALHYFPRIINSWDKLEKLDLTNNQWSCDCDNEYLIGTLLPQWGNKLMEEQMKRLKCSTPPEHAGKTLISLSTRHLRCLDIYGAQPEKDASILIGVFIGLLIAIPIGLLIFTFWRRGYFFCKDQSPASFSRAFYKRTPVNDE